MTKDEIDQLYAGAGILACLGVEKIHALSAHDAEQRRVIEQLEEKVKAYEGGCLHDSLVDQARTIDQQAQQIAALREALECCLAQIQDDIKQCGPCEHDVNICVCPLKILAAEAQQALKEVS